MKAGTTQKSEIIKEIVSELEESKRLNERLAEIERKANEERIKAEDEQYQLSLDLMAESAEKELLLSTIKWSLTRLLKTKPRKESLEISL